METALAPLTQAERSFVRSMLRGEDPDLAAAGAGWQGDLRGVDLLGRPLVRRALLALAPLLASDPRGRGIARGILRPFALARLADSLDVPGQSGLAAAREILAGTGGAASDPRRTWEARAARTGPGAGEAPGVPARGRSDNGAYGNPAPGQRLV